MTRQQDREEWVRLNTCRFCIGSHLHTCTGYRCEPAIKQAEEHFDRIQKTGGDKMSGTDIKRGEIFYISRGGSSRQ